MKNFFRKWGILIIIASALFIVVIDTTIINVSISDVVKDLDSDIPTMQQVITIYALVMASLLLIGGKLGDIYGRKKIFILGVAIYGIGTLTAALSQNMPTLLFGWAILEGIGGALMMPASQSLLMDNYEKKHDRTLAFGVWGAVAGLAVAVGPLFGGYLTTNASWRWAFALEVIIVFLVLSFSFLIKEKTVAKKIKLDYMGSLLSILGLSSLVYGILQAREYGWWTAKKIYEIGNLNLDFGELSIAPILIGIGLFFLAIMGFWLYYREKKGFDPLFSLKIFRFSNFNKSLAVLFLTTISMGGLMFVFPVFWQVVREYDAFETGMTFIPYSLAMIILSPLCGKLSKKISHKTIIQIGIIITAIGLLLINQNLNPEADMLDLFLPVGIFGSGMAMVLALLPNMLLSSVDKNFVGEASGLNSTLRQLGQSLGTAILGTIFLSMIVTNFTDEVEASKVFPENQKEMIITQTAKQSENLGGEIDYNQTNQLPKDIVSEINDIKNKATTDAAKNTFYYSLIFLGITFILSFWLPKEIKLKEN